MARFRMKPNKNIIGENFNEKDIISVEVQNATQMVHDALKNQLGKNMGYLYREYEWK